MDINKNVVFRVDQGDRSRGYCKTTVLSMDSGE